jgi:ABC-type dipeptide/oligopeptide/nickel transport system ATPase component
MLSGLLGTTSTFEQSIAVFGESGSGKTMLVSVFYGYQQSAEFKKRAGYSLLAEDTTQGQKLLQVYHRIEDDLLPHQTRFRQHSFAFGVRPHGLNADGCRITWHDYPGEWWTETRSGEEGQRKLEAFRALLSSDVALLLVDGQQLLEHQERYIPRLFKSFRDELARIGPSVTETGKKLASFPRVWIICLSKADLFPGKDVEWFKKEIHKQACDEMTSLREQIAVLVTRPECVTLGDEFLLLSSAQFDPFLCVGQRRGRMSRKERSPLPRSLRKA